MGSVLRVPVMSQTMLIPHHYAWVSNRYSLPCVYSLTMDIPYADSPDRWRQKRYSKLWTVHETAAAPLGSFQAIFSQAMSLGLLSKRRVYQEAMQVLQASEQGSLRSLIGKPCFMSASMTCSAASPM